MASLFGTGSCDFNPLHREGGDDKLFGCVPDSKISIHSTARVETLSGTEYGDGHKHFNPLHREGGDQPRLQSPSVPLPISIHSTARVETGAHTKPAASTWNFNPLHREGGDSNVQTFCRRTRDFNPLHREGGDQNKTNYKCYMDISIHSTARVETPVVGKRQIRTCSEIFGVLL